MSYFTNSSKGTGGSSKALSGSDFEPNTFSRLNVVVVGGGIAGLPATLGPRKQGHLVTILEQSDSSDEDGAPLDLTPNANDILKRFGVHVENLGGTGGAATSNGVHQTIHNAASTKLWQHVPELPRWHNERVVLIGEAAHAYGLRPVYSAGQALEDAAALAALLLLEVSADQVPEALQFYQEFRTFTYCARWILARGLQLPLSRVRVAEASWMTGIVTGMDWLLGGAGYNHTALLLHGVDCVADVQYPIYSPFAGTSRVQTKTAKMEVTKDNSITYYQGDELTLPTWHGYVDRFAEDALLRGGERVRHAGHRGREDNRDTIRIE
ncbi:RNA-binding protein 39 [Fonsecaea monophora]|uniref:RNA-binding protein 39 n=1 Tax=Fonsecaea monophora TaxID=254056 RepID=A0A177FDC8_9EURO|nr:RNA-binding protein 39 [Fonsecaea monophora]OAG42247.1 RNA-binding protein 39 [Fonsecaea monophora]